MQVRGHWLGSEFLAEAGPPPWEVARRRRRGVQKIEPMIDIRRMLQTFPLACHKAVNHWQLQ
eukprot:1247728-Amphidinium_carterae.1